ncbi:unnamed protein product [Effrenium voratum]|uniref:Phospholipase B-like n=1 Tax=Effrenium voratum TaxID=2562239 RepID=A0AA36MWC9_9DINO|nr:unnamed protein product [Effrenium voratum]
MFGYSNRTEYQKVKDFVVANDAFARSNINRSAASDEYWAEVAVLWAQLDGLVAGHAASCGELCIGLTEFLFLQAEQDLSSVQNIPSEWTYASAAAYTRETTHCSAIVKLAPNNSDLYMGHNTWTGYSSMLRVLKEYNLPLGGADQVAHSAYFGNLYSGDDFYVLSSGLTVQETTNSVYNKTSLEKIKPESLFTWARTVIANRKATDGASWVKWFSPFNSGTINNQWMIAEMHRFKANEDLPDRFFTVAEQMPGSIVWSDLTEVLRAQGFWVSYNSPFFPEIRVISGADDMEKRFGDAYSYTRNPRAKIFARDVRNATDMARVQRLLRYNDWQHDPLSAHGYGGPTEPNAPENAIAARYDLHPWASERKDFGNTDAKVCAAADCLRLRFSAISGPTAEDQPAFAWTGEWASGAHLGHPTLFNFSWVDFEADHQEIII